MSRAVLVLMMLSVALPLTELRAGQHRDVLDRLPILTADTPKQCCRVSKKGKACEKGASARSGSALRRRAARAARLRPVSSSRSSSTA